VLKRTWNLWQKLGLDEQVRQKNLPSPKEVDCELSPCGCACCLTVYAAARRQRLSLPQER
jgi:hypothetical protein